MLEPKVNILKIKVKLCIVVKFNLSYSSTQIAKVQTRVRLKCVFKFRAKLYENLSSHKRKDRSPARDGAMEGAINMKVLGLCHCLRLATISDKPWPGQI